MNDGYFVYDDIDMLSHATPRVLPPTVSQRIKRFLRRLFR